MARLAVDDADLGAAVDWLGASDTADTQAGPMSGVTKPAWWPSPGQSVRQSTGQLDGYAETRVGHAPDPDHPAAR